MVTSFADSIGFRVWVFLPSVGNVSWFTTACLKIAEQQFFYIRASFRMRELYRDKSNNALSSDRYHSYRYWSVLSRFWLILSRVCLCGANHMSMLFLRCVCCDALMPYIRKRKILFWDFSLFMPCSPLWKPISISIAHKMNLSTEVCENRSVQNRVDSQRTDFDFHFP